MPKGNGLPQANHLLARTMILRKFRTALALLRARPVIWAAVAVLALAGCRKAAPPAPTPEPEPARVSQREPRAWDDFEEKLTPLFDEPFELGEHSHPEAATAIIYTSPWAGTALRQLVDSPSSAVTEFRAGSLLVQKQDDGTVYVMRKRLAGTLPGSNEWYFALERDGRVLRESGQDDGVKEACVDCHSTLGAGTDWVIAPPRPASRSAYSASGTSVRSSPLR
jgi:hypothetical protein